MVKTADARIARRPGAFPRRAWVLRVQEEVGDHLAGSPSELGSTS
jgi:hypothetical protein